MVIPTNMPIIRKDEPDVVYKSKEVKFDAIVKLIEKTFMPYIGDNV